MIGDCYDDDYYAHTQQSKYNSFTHPANISLILCFTVYSFIKLVERIAVAVEMKSKPSSMVRSTTANET